MRATQNDLSGGLARLDYGALVIVARVAVRELLEKIMQYRCSIIDNKSLSSICLDAQWMREASQELEIATETLATLVGGLEDRNVKIVNKTNGL